MYGKKNIQRDEYKFNILIAKKKERKKIKQIQDRKRQWEVEREKERGRERMCEEIQMTKKTKTVSHEKLSVLVLSRARHILLCPKGDILS